MMSQRTSESAEGEFAAPRAARAGEATAAAAAAAAAASGAGPRVVIESEETGVQLNLGDLWNYRELLYFLTLRDVKVRYKQTLMGALWVVVQPLMMMIIVTLVFNKFARIDAGSLAYPLFAYAGLMLWTFFSNAVTSSTNSLVSNAELITKVYFPRAFIPAAAVGAGLVDLAIASLVLVGLAVYYGAALGWQLLLAPLFVAVAVMFALGVGLLVSSLTVKYRDLRHALPFTLQFWMLASPVIYPVSIIPDDWRWLLYVNPLTGIIEGFRASITGASPDWTLAASSAAISTATLLVAFYVFRKLEDTFADLI